MTAAKTLSLMGAALALVGAACEADPNPPWAMRRVTEAYTFPARDADGEVVPEGQTYSADELNKGREAYIHYCYACHGMNGDGKGPASHGLRPPPRDLRLGAFKFGAVRSGERPNDVDFVRIVQGGLHGTAMLPWDIPHDQLWLIVQFIKTFPKPPCNPFAADAECQARLAKYPGDSEPSVWVETFKRDNERKGQRKGQPVWTGDPVTVPEDPWQGRAAEAIARGAALYHLKAQCASCHPSYLTQEEHYRAAVKEDPSARPSFRERMHLSIVLPAEKNPYGVSLMPPDFTLNPLRSIRVGHELDDLYRLIASGVGGVMPQWVDALAPEEIWALAHYVKSLADLRSPANRQARYALKDKLANARPFTIPTAASEPQPTDR